MLRLRKPDARQIAALLKQGHGAPFSYTEIGATSGEMPRGYRIIQNQVDLGRGRDVFDRAAAALRGWKMYPTGWVERYPADVPVEKGMIVASLARPLGIWSLQMCRIVYVVEEHGAIERLAFAYGTIEGHPLAGEERFEVAWRSDSDQVYYKLTSFSRPVALTARLGYPVVRHFQQRFVRDSLQSIVKTVQRKEA